MCEYTVIMVDMLSVTIMVSVCYQYVVRSRQSVACMVCTAHVLSLLSKT